MSGVRAKHGTDDWNHLQNQAMLKARHGSDEKKKAYEIALHGEPEEGLGDDYDEPGYYDMRKETNDTWLKRFLGKPMLDVPEFARSPLCKNTTARRIVEKIVKKRAELARNLKAREAREARLRSSLTGGGRWCATNDDVAKLLDELKGLERACELTRVLNFSTSTKHNDGFIHGVKRIVRDVEESEQPDVQERSEQPDIFAGQIPTGPTTISMAEQLELDRQQAIMDGTLDDGDDDKEFDPWAAWEENMPSGDLGDANTVTLEDEVPPGMNPGLMTLRPADLPADEEDDDMDMTFRPEVFAPARDIDDEGVGNITFRKGDFQIPAHHGSKLSPIRNEPVDVSRVESSGYGQRRKTTGGGRTFTAIHAVLAAVVVAASFL